MAHTLLEIGLLGAEDSASHPWMPALLRFLQAGLGVRLRPFNPSLRPTERLIVLGPPGSCEIPPTVRIVLHLPPPGGQNIHRRVDWVEPGPIPVYGDPLRFPRLGELPWHYMGGGAPVSWTLRRGQTLLQVGFDALSPLARALARMEEREAGGDAWREARLDALPAEARHVALTPWVDRLLRFFARLLDLDSTLEPAPLPRWPGGASWAVALSHDVDMLFKWRLRSVMRLLMETPLHALDGRRALLARRWAELLERLRTGRDPWFVLDELMDLEQRRGVVSTLLFLAEPRDHQTFRYHLGRAQVRGLLARLRQRSFELGLHGGWSSHQRGDVLREQARSLEGAGAGRPRITRQHWLRFDIHRTWEAQVQAGLSVDSTLGFNDRPGFRAGCSLPFHPLNAHGLALPLLELPLLLMDSQLYDEQALGPIAAERQSAELLEQVRRVGGLLTVNWHPHTLCRADFPGRREHYERLLERIDEPDCWVGGLGAVADHWLIRETRLEADAPWGEASCAS